jgi:hypothetical protein
MAALGLSAVIPRLATAARRRLDLADPADNIRALVKTLGDSAGRDTFTISFGRIFGAGANDLARPLFDFKAARITSFKARENGAYETRFRGMIYFTDIRSGRIIDSWRNPYTDRDDPVTHWETGGETGYTYTVTGTVPRAEFKGELGDDKRGRPFILPWIVNGDDVWLTLDERVKYTRRTDGALRTDNAIMRYQTVLSELEDDSRSSATCHTSWHTEQNWMPWMRMDAQPGRLMWGGAGRKYERLDQLPADFVAEVERRRPGALSKPISWS